MPHHFVCVRRRLPYLTLLRSPTEKCLSSVERYDPALDAWEAVAPMAEGRRDHAAAVLGGKLYAVGGSWVSSVERYDPAVGAWEAVAPMAEERMKLCAC